LLFLHLNHLARYNNEDINKCKITKWKERSKTELTGRSPLSRRTSAMDCSVIEEEAEEEEEEEEEAEKEQSPSKVNGRQIDQELSLFYGT
jgi:hypothetical protein